MSPGEARGRIGNEDGPATCRLASSNVESFMFLQSTERVPAAVRLRVRGRMRSRGCGRGRKIRRHDEVAGA